MEHAEIGIFVRQRDESDNKALSYPIRVIMKLYLYNSNVSIKNQAFSCHPR